MQVVLANGFNRGSVRSPFCRIGVGIMASVLMAASAVAQQNYPAKNITIISPFAAGTGTIDTAQRYLGDEFRKRTGHGFIMDNRPGANGSIGALALLKAPTDGHFMGFASGSYASNPAFFKLPYQFSDFQPVVQWSIIPLALLAPPTVPARSFKEYLAWAKAQPHPINIGIIGVLPKLTWRQVSQGGGFKVNEIYYKGVPEAFAAVMGGFVDGYFGPLDAALTLSKDNKLKVIAVGTEKRVPSFPNTETVWESIPGVTSQGWGGFIMSAQTPRQYAERVNREIREIMKMPETLSLWEKLGMIPSSQSTQEFGELILKEAATVSRLAKDAGMEPQAIGQ